MHKKRSAPTPGPHYAKNLIMCVKTIGFSLPPNALVGRAMGGWLSQSPNEHNVSFLHLAVPETINSFFSISFLLSLFGIGIHSRSLQDVNNFRMFTCHVFLSLLLVLTSCIMVALGGWVLYMDQENSRKFNRENDADGPIYGGGNVPQGGFFYLRLCAHSYLFHFCLSILMSCSRIKFFTVQDILTFRL